MSVHNTYIGRPMERVEDLRMVRGRGTYVSDVNPPGQLHAVILRSSIAHGLIRSIDTERGSGAAGRASRFDGGGSRRCCAANSLAPAAFAPA